MIRRYNKKNGKIIGVLEKEFDKSKFNDESKLTVEILYCGICGTDFQKYIGMDNVEEWGHEIIGKVIDDNSQQHTVSIRTTYPCDKCEDCKNGHREKCKNWKRLDINGFSNEILVEKNSIINIDSADIVYSLIEPLYVANSLVEHIIPSQDSTYSIIGNGTIGLLSAFLIKKKYDAKVRVVGRRNLHNRRKFTKKIGADYYDFKDMENALKGCDKIIITTPYNTIPQIVKLAEPYSNITFNGISKETRVEMELDNWHFKNINIWPSFPHPQNDFSEEIQIIKDNAELLRSIITNIFPLEKIEDAFELLKDKTKDNIKILIDCRRK